MYVNRIDPYSLNTRLHLNKAFAGVSREQMQTHIIELEKEKIISDDAMMRFDEYIYLLKKTLEDNDIPVPEN